MGDLIDFLTDAFPVLILLLFVFGGLIKKILEKALGEAQKRAPLAGQKRPQARFRGAGRQLRGFLKDLEKEVQGEGAAGRRAQRAPQARRGAPQRRRAAPEPPREAQSPRWSATPESPPSSSGERLRPRTTAPGEAKIKGQEAGKEAAPAEAGRDLWDMRRPPGRRQPGAGGFRSVNMPIRGPDDLRQAVIWFEIFSKPKALKSRELPLGGARVTQRR